MTDHDVSPQNKSLVHRASGRLSGQLSRTLPYYITSDEAHKLIAATENDRDRLFLRLLWKTGLRVSEAINVKLVGVAGRAYGFWARALGKGLSLSRTVQSAPSCSAPRSRR